ncbi:hypothetical protein ACQUSY_12890 [Microbacterium sp. YY-03]|uniref:hypothetical protein n=1 Tax=Microbacterium sp. YY-03 TaxID=3421636 RepID=UPI003D179B6F
MHNAETGRNHGAGQRPATEPRTTGWATAGSGTTGLGGEGRRRDRDLCQYVALPLGSNIPGNAKTPDQMVEGF